jgi:uncharacterized Zn-finger protein
MFHFTIHPDNQETRPMSTKAEAIKVDSKNIACDGGAGQLGHPRVFLAFGDDQKATCPYCGQIFILEAGSDPAKH